MPRPSRASLLRDRALLGMMPLFVLAGLLVVSSTARAAPPVTFDIGAKKDNTLYEPPPGQELSNGAGQHLFVGTTANPAPNGDIRRALVAFDVAAAIPAGSTITQVVLTLNMSRTMNGTQAITVHRVTADWGEGTSDAVAEEGGGAAPASGDATWINRFFPGSPWTNPGGDFSSTISASNDVSGTGLYSWGSSDGLVADVQGWLDDPASNFGWVLIGPESVAQTAKRFDSRENSTAANSPKLTVTYTPLVDCNHNGKPDDSDIALGTSANCNHNGVPDECELDTDGDGVIDACDNCPDVANADQADANQNGIGDACEVTQPGDGGTGGSSGTNATSQCGTCGAMGTAGFSATVLGIRFVRVRRALPRRARSYRFIKSK
jgi:Thrombospondin type 3 repeat